MTFSSDGRKPAQSKFAQRRLLVFVQRLVFGRRDPVADLRRGCPGVQHPGQRRHRVGALLASAHRHMGRLVCAENGQRMLQRLKLVAEFIEFGERHLAYSRRMSAKTDGMPPLAASRQGDQDRSIWRDPCSRIS
jgi:hypothetical protein